jgi:hypothetical protein
MTTRKTTVTRTIRVAIGTAAVLALMSQAAQARPSGLPAPAGNTQATASSSILKNKLVQKGTYMPLLPASPDAKVARALGAGGQVGTPAPTTQTATGKTGIDWFAAAIGAGFALSLVLIVTGAGALIVKHGRRRDPLSA